MKRRKIIPYNPALKEKARELRNNSTKTEILLWLNLKGKQMRGYDFHRQKPIDNYIVDFFCNELMLAIEIYPPLAWLMVKVTMGKKFMMKSDRRNLRVWALGF